MMKIYGVLGFWGFQCTHLYDEYCYHINVYLLVAVSKNLKTPKEKCENREVISKKKII